MKNDLIGPVLRQRIESLVAGWLCHRVELCNLRHESDPRLRQVEWITDFIVALERDLRPVVPVGAKPRSGIDMSQPFDCLMDRTVVSAQGELVRVREMVRLYLVPQVACGVVRAVVRLFQTPDMQSQRQLLLESGQASLGALEARLKEMDAAQDLEEIVTSTIERELGSRSVASLFYRSDEDNGYRGYRVWWAGSWSAYGRGLQQAQLEQAHGVVRLQWARYDTSSPVQPYEWMAQLHATNPSSALPDAVALGMIYKFPRRRGRLLGHVVDLVDGLVEAADTVADTDILQVSAFLNQYRDTTAVISESDLCFLWIWERRNTSEAGAGKACLVAAMQELRRRFPMLKTLVVDIAPAQFHPCGPLGEPPSIAVDRLNAVDRLQAYVDGLSEAAGLQVRGIVNRHEGSGDQGALALMALNDPRDVQ